MHAALHKTMAAAMFVLCTSTQAAPAPWFWWVSKANGQRVCAQVMPSQGWLRGEGPFHNAQCASQRKALIQLR